MGCWKLFKVVIFVYDEEKFQVIIKEYVGCNGMMEEDIWVVYVCE